MEERRILSLKEWKKATGKTSVFGTTCKDPGLPLRKGLIATVGRKEPTEEGVESRILTFTISTDSVDRDRDTISAEGWALDNYRKNPVVLWAHSHYDPPIARSPEIGVEKGALVAEADFVPRDISEFADMIFRMYLGKFLNAVSVGFDPTEWSFVEDNERPFGVDFKKQELLEFSSVPVPANPEALIAAAAKGIDLEPLRKWAVDILDDFERVTKEGLYLPKRPLLETIARGSKVSVDFPADPIEATTHQEKKVPEQQLKPSPMKIHLACKDGKVRSIDVPAPLAGDGVEGIMLEQYGVKIRFDHGTKKNRHTERVQVDGGHVTVSYQTEDGEFLPISYPWIAQLLNFGRAKGYWRYDAQGKQWHFNLLDDPPEKVSRFVIAEEFLSDENTKGADSAKIGTDQTKVMIATRGASGIQFAPVTLELLEELLAKEDTTGRTTLFPSLEKLLEGTAEIIDALLIRNEDLSSRVPITDLPGATQGIIDGLFEAINEKGKAEKKTEAQEASGQELFCGLTREELKNVIKNEVEKEVTRSTGRVF